MASLLPPVTHSVRRQRRPSANFETNDPDCGGSSEVLCESASELGPARATRSVGLPLDWLACSQSPVDFRESSLLVWSQNDCYPRRRIPAFIYVYYLYISGCIFFAYFMHMYTYFGVAYFLHIYAYFVLHIFAYLLHVYKQDIFGPCP